MAREPRIEYPGAIYHVMNRGDRRAILVDDRDRGHFMEVLAKVRDRYGVLVAAPFRSEDPPGAPSSGSHG